LNGAEIARQELYLQSAAAANASRRTNRYGFAEAHTSYGVIGGNAGCTQGEMFPERGTEKVAPLAAATKRNGTD